MSRKRSSSFRPLLPDRPSSLRGAVYLLHFDRAFGHARHYIGFSTDPDERFQHHLLGRGANLVKHALAAGVSIELAQLWENKTVRYEIELKNRGSAIRWCPVCKRERAVDVDVDAETLRLAAV